MWILEGLDHTLTPHFIMEGRGRINYKNWTASYIPHILKELYLDKVYEPYLGGRKDLTIIDAGFNIGLFSLYASRFAKQIYAFEPATETYEIGKLNLVDNGIENVKLFKQAISKDDGEITFYHLPNTTASNTIPESKNISTGEETVPTVRLDTFVKNEKIEHIDFAKIDIEGTEDEVLGSESFQNIVPILDAFVMELHPWTKTNPQQIVTTIRDYGYKVTQIPSEATILGCTK